MLKLFNTLWNEPSAPNPPNPLWRDWVLVAVFSLAAVAEGYLADDLRWPVFTTTLLVVLIFTLPWRRVYPLQMIVIAFGTTALVQIYALANQVSPEGLSTNLFVVIMPYALLRWGSGREAILGIVVVAMSLTVAMSFEQRSWLEVLGASLFLLFPAALGASVRYQDSAMRSKNEQIRLQEREQLARELHDTVAHHVSAIAIQAQAGRALAATQPNAPIEVLGVIEEAASRTLTEMRQIVHMLRDSSELVHVPVARLADIKRLASDKACPLNIKLNFEGNLDDLNSTLESTLFRLAQEAITNAVRHATHATNMDILISGDSEKVHLKIVDDGVFIPHPPLAGLGLRGMTERVTLLGGTVLAAPGNSRGWIVEATLPKNSSAAKR